MSNRERFNQAAGMLGARRDDTGDRAEHDFYATDPVAIEKLMQIEELNHRIWEPACGQGHLAKPLVREGYDVKSTDLIYRGYGEGGVDFLQQREKWEGDIITNPPYNLSHRFVEHALQIIPDGCKACFFLKLTFLEGQGRKDFFTIYPPPDGLGIISADQMREERQLRRMLFYDGAGVVYMAEGLARRDNGQVVLTEVTT